MCIILNSDASQCSHNFGVKCRHTAAVRVNLHIAFDIDLPISVYVWGLAVVVFYSNSVPTLAVDFRSSAP